MTETWVQPPTLFHCLVNAISTTLPSPDRLVQQIMTPRGYQAAGSTRQRMEDGHIKFYSVKQMAVTFIPHTIHVDGIFTYISLIYMVDLWMLWVLFYQNKQLYTKKHNKTNKTSLRTFLFSLLNQCPERPAVRVVQKQNSWSRSTGHCDGSAIQPCA